MAFNLTDFDSQRMDGRKFHWYHISNGFSTPRAGQVVLRCTGTNGGYLNAWIDASGVTVAQHEAERGYDCTVSAFVPAGVTINSGWTGNFDYLIFMEL